MKMNMALKTRFSNLHDDFVFAGYRWTFKDEVASKDHTKSLNYTCTPLKNPPEIDILTVFNNKFSNYRMSLDIMMSLMYDYTVCDVKVILVDSDEFNVSIIYCDGTELFQKIRMAYKRISGPAAWPIIETNNFFNGTAFPLLSIAQYSNPFSYSKGYLQCLYKLDKNGELISDHYSSESLDHGIPVISLMLTYSEYKKLKPSFEDYEGYEMICDLPNLIDILGAGNNDVGTVLLWLCFLIDTQASLEYWTFNQAHDGDPLKITTIHRVNFPDPPENMNGETVITMEAAVCGIMSEGVEAVIIEDPNDGKPTNTCNEAHFNVTFCNGYENEKMHAANVKRMGNVIFDNLYNDIPSFGWKLGKDEGSKYTGLLCVSDDITYIETKDMQYVRNTKYTIKYHPYFFCSSKSMVRKLRLDYSYKKIFGNKFEKHMIMYPVKEGNSVSVYRSWAKDPETKKYKYMALISIKDYKTTDIDNFSAFLESLMGIDGITSMITSNPINDGLFCDLIDEFMRPYLNIRDKNVCATLVGKKLLVMENITKKD